ncbi:phenylacetate-CoA oxygenase/reductase subunit PaaK [Pseudoflavitalea sp. X16]|uniref:1,2-phenylacetyl-CoA epoxidase subunit PaaE n=1 Tax=Paraflavitalea devenefica TaxID=2716334 RepID=UPI0014222189|nr:1,2-phenylacetyl-CoA epoxidase subunit PaaE [Paraflavitalea devenefica]NII24274.1 phenylacetate-CoA oxygenase/reductase subunit PaaK [Paraflavitalea devenefica]
MATHFHTLTVATVQKETPECISVVFQVPEALQELYNFKQGQNITLKTILNGEELRRSYSICSSPFDKELRVAIKSVETGRFSSWANNQLKKGDLVEVLPPTGRFFTELHPAHKKHYLAFAAGSGITPILSIIKTTLATEPQSRFTLIYGNRNRASIIFKEQLEALKNRYMERFTLHHILSREKTDAPLNHGRIDPEKCRQLEKLINFAQMDEIFLCGPETMIFSVKNWLEEKGMEKKKIHFELFTTPATGSQQPDFKPQAADLKPQTAGKKSRVTVKLDGIAFDFDLGFDGQPILDAALQQGADLPFACKGGVCATCRAKLVEGQVEMDINYALEPEEMEQGFILTCQSHPRTDKVVVDFDAR